jgi:hypothetical protein
MSQNAVAEWKNLYDAYLVVPHTVRLRWVIEYITLFDTDKVHFNWNHLSKAKINFKNRNDPIHSS